jgi:hypothetical protein
MDIPEDEVWIPTGEKGRPPKFSPKYGLEHRALAYEAFLKGANWTDCARAFAHHDPAKTGRMLVKKWAKEDGWRRSIKADQQYKMKIEQKITTDPVRISREIDILCLKMQQVAENYIEGFFDVDDEGQQKVVIDAAFKTRDFADMAAALRMIHETRIKIRKATEDVNKTNKQGGKDFISFMKEIGQEKIAERNALVKIETSHIQKEGWDAWKARKQKIDRENSEASEEDNAGESEDTPYSRTTYPEIT